MTFKFIDDMSTFSAMQASDLYIDWLTAWKFINFLFLEHCGHYYSRRGTRDQVGMTKKYISFTKAPSVFIYTD